MFATIGLMPDGDDVPEVYLAVFKAVAVGLAEDAIETGEIDITGMSPAEIVEELQTKIVQEALEVPPLRILDYMSSILEEANRYHNAGKHAFAVVFYTTWIEHWVNSMIIRACKRRGYGSKDSEKVFVRAILSDKVGPIWHLLFDDPLASSIAQTIKEIGDTRNSFLHYKWPGVLMDDAEAHDSRYPKASSTARDLIPQLIEIEDRLIFGGRRAEIRHVIEDSIGSVIREDVGE
jgi:hypothetical protein